MVEREGLEFCHIPVTPEDKPAAFARVAELLRFLQPDLVVLARYMQILSPDFVARWPGRIINIHHSFLPAFVGARPYHQAQQRGVKLIGATAHYVTEDLDEGPIIDQEVQRVGHDYSVDDLIRVGRDVERITLAHALRWHLDDRVLVHEGRTIILL